MVSQWMANGNIMEYISKNAGNHLKLVGHDHTCPCHVLSTFQLVDAAEGLRYLHNANIVHGDLKGVSLPIGTPQPPLTLFRPIYWSKVPTPSRHASQISGSRPWCLNQASKWRRWSSTN